MKSSFPGRALRFMPGAFLVLLGLFGVAPSAAWAGCNHYVTTSASRTGLGSIAALDVIGLSAVGSG